MTKGIEIKDLTIGTGNEATKESVVAVNVREFLRRGDEVNPSPLFGTRHLIDLRRRECIAGLRYGIPGMRVGGKREIIISPHLAYGEAGIPGKIPPNALLRCEVELLEIRKYNALLPQDWLPGKTLTLSGYRDHNDQSAGWSLRMHEGGNSLLVFGQTIPDKQPTQIRWTQIAITLDAQESAEVIREAMDLPKQIPADCVEWNSEFIEKRRGDEIRDRRNGVRCLVVQIREDGTDMLIFGVHANSPQFRDSRFFRTIEQLIGPHLDELTRIDI
jgi:hypothetical protein